MRLRVAITMSAEQNLQNTCVLGECSVRVGNRSLSRGSGTAHGTTLGCTGGGAMGAR